MAVALAAAGPFVRLLLLGFDLGVAFAALDTWPMDPRKIPRIGEALWLVYGFRSKEEVLTLVRYPHKVGTDTHWDSQGGVVVTEEGLVDYPLMAGHYIWPEVA